MKIDSFDLEQGEVIHGQYEIIDKLGDGWEGEVYLVRELSTGVERAAKFFFPHRNKYNRTSKYYAKKLHKLRNCDIVIHYHFQDMVFLHDTQVTYLVSEYIEGELLSDFIKRQPYKRLNIFAAVHLLHSLALGIEAIHKKGEYHGDLHTDNIIVNMRGIGFEVKVLDLINLGKSSAPIRRADIIDLIQIFYEALGGKKNYSKLPKEIKQICCGLKTSLIMDKFPTVKKLREHLESMDWK